MKLKTKYSTVWLVNLVDDEGNPSWPERYADKDIQRIIDDTDYFSYNREYMNNPVEEGKLIKADQIIYRDAKPFSSYPLLLGHWDLSYKAEGDYKAMALLGFDEKGLIILDLFCRRCDLSVAVDYHFDLTEKINFAGTSVVFLFDATAAQEEVFLPAFVKEAERRKNFNLPIPDRTATVDKFLRIEATLTPLFHHGKIAFARHLKDKPDTKTAITQLLAIERGSKANDDFPDTLEAACRLILKYSYDVTEPVSNGRVVLSKPNNKKKAY
ncbi:MAG: hypothetical protein PHU33_15945 [Bacteroidales bacterium]|nr:hypothetical protein [Bacteroidales bacterium]